MTKQKPTGLSRIIKAAGYSWAGLKTAWNQEAAFRQELAILAVFFPLGLFLGKTGMQRAALISSIMIVIVTELLNSAIEAAMDRVGPEYHPKAGQAKDLGSAAVFISLLIVAIVWILILI